MKKGLEMHDADARSLTIKERIDLISDNKNLSLDTEYTTSKIELCGICNMACKFCYEKELAKNHIRQKLMTMDDLRLVLDTFKEKIPSMKEVGLFYMGEAGLHPELDKAYKMCKDYGYFTFLTTNGLLIKNTLKAMPYIDSLKMSWNYKSREDFVYKTGLRDEQYDTVISNAKRLKKECNSLGKKFTVSTILYENESKDEYKESLDSIEYDHNYFLPLQTQAGYNSIGTNGVVGQYDNQSSSIPCWSLFKGVYIDSDLNIRTCCYGHTDEFIIGNIKNKPIFDKDIFKKQQLHGEIPDICKGCLRVS